MEIRKYYVYNHTRESFLSLGVIVADSSMKQLKVLIENLSVKADNGLWLMPFRGMPTSRGQSSVDMIYLDEDYRVIQAIESFPNSAFEPTRRLCASGLVLAPNTIASSRTQAEDKLVICGVEEIERQLEKTADHTTVAHFQPEISDQSRVSRESQVIVETQTVGRTAEMQISRQRLIKKDAAELDALKNASWFIRFMRWLPTDRRKAKRHPLPGLVAYYWTGGAPQAYHIADISAGGMYLLTDERWFPGTVILMTLQRVNTDGGDPDDYIAVQAKVTRWGNDGVGLSFVQSNAVPFAGGIVLPETSAGQNALLTFVQRVQAPSV